MNKSQKNKNMEGILMSANIRKMIESDIKNFANAFKLFAKSKFNE